ncbi:hypothetical protein [Streptomyces sp. WM6378]|uniref:hypothetical protein n=1 Tax=Streptomyces sp. WM6378 TaxID=1415557 RepID=UPI001F15C3D4|nr:hypothetical protein [Streptomyces sp. WM6378]
MSDSMPGPEAEPEVQADVESEVVGPSPLDVPRGPTGDAGIDALVERLGDVDHLGTDGHLEVYEDVHRGLRGSLTALDARQGPAPVPGAGLGTSGRTRPLGDQRP